jgi:hypothetical protein
MAEAEARIIVPAAGKSEKQNEKNKGAERERDVPKSRLVVLSRIPNAMPIAIQKRPHMINRITTAQVSTLLP